MVGESTELRIDQRPFSRILEVVLECPAVEEKLDAPQVV